MNVVVSVELGAVVMTAGVSQWVVEDPGRMRFLCECLLRHRQGDWGAVCADDSRANDAACVNGERLLSAYPVPHLHDEGDAARRLWVITEWDRTATTLLWPEEY